MSKCPCGGVLGTISTIFQSESPHGRATGAFMYCHDCGFTWGVKG